MTDTVLSQATASSTDVVVAASEIAIEELSHDQAIAITNRIRDSFTQIEQLAANVEQLVAEAHSGKAWKALDYANWDEYVRSEFGKERTWSFNMLTKYFVRGALTQAIEAGGGDPDSALLELVTTKEMEAVKGNLDEVTTEIRERIAEEPERAAQIVKEAVQKAERQRKPRLPKEAEPLAETTVEIQGAEILDAEIVDDEETEEIKAAVAHLISLIDQIDIANYVAPEKMAEFIVTGQWEKINRFRIWLQRFQMVMP